MNISLGGVIDNAKEYAKNRIKRAAAKLLLKLAKKAIIALGKAVMLIGKLLVAIAGLLGVKGILILLVVVLVGGAIMYIMPFFGWFSEGSKSPKTPEELAAEYRLAVQSTSSYDEYRPPQLLIQYIDNIRIMKEKKDLWEIDPERVVKNMEVDITKDTFTNRYEDEEGSVSTETVRLITQVHAWNRIETITYKEEKSYGSYNTTDKDGNKVTIKYTSTSWVEDKRTSIPDFSKLDQALLSLKYSSSDFDLLIDTIIANNQDFLAGYNGQFGMVYNNDVGWWDEDSNIGTGQWIWPTISTRITSAFYIRSDPFTGETKMHNGIDIGVPVIDGKYDTRSQPIFSVADGKVTYAGSRGGFGNVVFVDHGSGLVTLYAHLKSISVEVDNEIAAGTVVGIMGSTGRSTGIHLHFSVMKDGKYDNPLKYIKKPE